MEGAKNVARPVDQVDVAPFDDGNRLTVGNRILLLRFLSAHEAGLYAAAQRKVSPILKPRRSAIPLIIAG